MENNNNGNAPKVDITVNDIITVAEMYLAEDENFRRCVMAAAKSRVKAVAVKGGDNVSVKDDQAVATAGSKKHG